MAGRMTNTAADSAVMDRVYGLAADELRQFVERIEQLGAERREVQDRIREVMAEAKGRGYDLRALRRVIADRQKGDGAVAEEEAVIGMYRAALGFGR